MAQDSKRACPDCLEYESTGFFGRKGNGICKECEGKGRVSNGLIYSNFGPGVVLNGLATSQMTEDEVYEYYTSPCPICKEEKQCQTCGGTGYEYYNTEEDGPSDRNEENASTDSTDENQFEESGNYEIDDESYPTTGSVTSTDETLINTDKRTPISSLNLNISYFIGIMILIISVVPIYNLTRINVLKKTHGKDFGFFYNGEVFLELILFYGVAFLLISILTGLSILIQVISKNEKSIISIVINSIVIGTGYYLVYLWFSGKILNS